MYFREYSNRISPVDRLTVAQIGTGIVARLPNGQHSFHFFFSASTIRVSSLHSRWYS